MLVSSSMRPVSDEEHEQFLSSFPGLMSITYLRTPNAVYIREEQRKSLCAGTKLATVNGATRIATYRYSVSGGAASTHGLNTATRAFSKSLVSRETIVKS
jgi:hypothetical protein